MSLTTVLFDIDGTLVDSNYAHVAAWSRAFAELGQPADSWRIHQAIGMGSTMLLDTLLGDRAKELGERATSLHSQYFLETADQLHPFESAVELLRVLSSRGLRVVLATSASAKELGALLEVLPVQEIVAAITSSEDAEAAKPHPDILHAALNRVNSQASEAIMVGDAVWDVQAAARANLDCIGLLSGGTGAGELRDAGAIAIYDDPADLLAKLSQSPLAG